jgi:hypothetical protein
MVLLPRLLVLFLFMLRSNNIQFYKKTLSMKSYTTFSKIIIKICCIVWLCIGMSWDVLAQNYILKEGQAGLDLSVRQSYLITLNPIVNDIIQEFADEDRTKFKVYDWHYFEHSNNINTKDLEEKYKKIKDFSGKSQYYMDIILLSVQDKVEEKVKINLKLPNIGTPGCMDETKVTLLESRIANTINDKIKASSGLIDARTFKAGLDVLYSAVKDVKGGNCCPFTDDEVKKMLVDAGFNYITLPTNTIFTNSTNKYNSDDYAKLIYNGDNIASKLNYFASGFPSSSSYHTYITSNYSICSNTDFVNVKKSYELNLDDFDVWFHIFVSQNGSESLIFCKNEMYANVNIPFTGTLPSFQNNGNTESTTVDNYLTLDPETNELYYSNEFAKLPTYIDEAELPFDKGAPYFTVTSTSDNEFNKIAALFDWDFLQADLVRWNPTLTEPIPIGIKVYLFKEDYEESIKEYKSGLNIDFEKIGSDNMKVKLNTLPFVTNKTKLSKESRIFVESVKKYLPQIDDQDIVNTLTDEYLKSLHKSPVINESLIIPKKNNEGYKELFLTGALKEVLTKDITVPILETIITESSATVVLVSGEALMLFGVSTVFIGLPLLYPDPVVIPNSSKRNIPDNPRIKKSKKWYICYTKFNPSIVNPGDPTIPNSPPLKLGRVYAGRTSGYGGICDILKARESNHHLRYSISGYRKPRLDFAGLAYLPNDQRHKDKAYQFMRGREEVDIRGLGGVIETFDPIKKELVKNYKTRSINKIPGISEKNYKNTTLYNRTKLPLEYFLKLGTYHPIRPSLDWDGSFINICLFQP